MAMYPTNTKLEDWFTIWLVDEVDNILLQNKKIRYVGEYTGMSKSDRIGKKLPHDRATCIEFIRQHRPNAGAQPLD